MNGRAFAFAFFAMVAGLLLALSVKGLVFVPNTPSDGFSQPEQESGVTLELRRQEASLKLEKEALLLEIAQTDARIEELEAIIAGQSQRAEETLKELEATRVLSGQKDMTGPGVRIVLDDAPRENYLSGEDVRFLIVHDIDVLRVVNRLRGAGAECVSINGERLVSNSRIRCGGPTIHVKDRPLAPPFEILAIGDPEALYRSLAAPSADGGMSELELLRFFGVQAQIEKVDEITVPRYIRELSFAYAYADAKEGNKEEGSVRLNG